MTGIVDLTPRVLPQSRSMRHESAFELCLQSCGQSVPDPTASSEPEVALSPIRVIRQGDGFHPMEHQLPIRTAVA